MSYDAVLFLDINPNGSVAARAIAEVLGSERTIERDGACCIVVPDVPGHVWVMDIVPEDDLDEYMQMLWITPFERTREEPEKAIDALGRSVFDRLCEATPWRIALTVDDGDRIVEVRPAIDSPT